MADIAIAKQTMIRTAVVWWFATGLVLTILSRGPFYVFSIGGLLHAAAWPLTVILAPLIKMTVYGVVIAGSAVFAWLYLRKRAARA